MMAINYICLDPDMFISVKKCLFAFVLGLFFVPLYAQPANDNYASAIDVSAYLPNSCSADAAYTTLNATADNLKQAVTMAKPGRMYAKPDTKASVVRDLDPGMMLYPTGEKQGMFWKVSDELGNEGWVPSTLFQLAK